MKSGICILDNYQLIQISGEDAAKFLHGQLTVDTENWNNDVTRIAAHCDFKGKMWSVSYLFKLPTDDHDSFCMCLNKDAGEQSFAQFKKYGVFSKVDIAKNDAVHLISFIGSAAESALSNIFGELPTNHLSFKSHNGNSVFCLSQSQPRYIAVLSDDQFESLHQNHGDLFVPGDLHEWLEVTDGFGSVSGPAINEYVPQMFNLHSLDAIDFDKGCYMGQEVVARTKFLGKNKRALYLLETQSDNSKPDELTIGATVERQVGDSWRRAGTIIRASALDDKSRYLAVLPNDIEVDETIRSKDNPEQEMKVLPLPYNVE